MKIFILFAVVELMFAFLLGVWYLIEVQDSKSNQRRVDALMKFQQNSDVDYKQALKIYRHGR